MPCFNVTVRLDPKDPNVHQALAVLHGLKAKRLDFWPDDYPVTTIEGQVPYHLLDLLRKQPGIASVRRRFLTSRQVDLCLMAVIPATMCAVLFTPFGTISALILILVVGIRLGMFLSGR